MPDASETALPSGGPSFVRIPLSRRKGLPAYALVDQVDAPLVAPLLWHENKDGYAVRTVDPATGEKEPMARRIMGLVKGDGLEVDHISQDKLDNRRVNLRVVTHAENGQNQSSRAGSSSRYRGVTRRKGKTTRPWQAYGCVDYKLVHLRFHEEEIEAARAAEAFRRKHMPYAVPEAELDPVPDCPCKACRQP